MNNRYLFRAKRVDNGEFVIGNYQRRFDLLGNEEHYIFCSKSHNAWEYAEVDPSTICQCTGLKDRNGKLIWENNVVTGWFDDKRITGYIKYGSNGIFYIERNGLYGIHLDNSQDWLEVIGNIFDNQELLEQEG